MEQVFQQLFQAYPFLHAIWDKIYIIIPFSMMFAYAGVLFISVTAKIIGQAGSRIMFAKSARQLARLGLVLGWVLLIGGRIWLYLTKSNYADGSLENYLLEISWMLLSMGVFLTSIYYCLWGILKNMPVLHATLGILSAVQNCLSLAVMLFTARILKSIVAGNSGMGELPDLFPNVWNDPLWSALCYTFPLIFGMAGAFAACWTAFLRKHDDFGRDYYKTMLPWVAAWARNAWFLLLLLLGCALCIQTGYGLKRIEWLGMETFWFLCWLLPLFIWFLFCKSRFPLRNTWSLWAALILAITFMPAYYLDIVRM